ncbi:hypothetical protein [Desulfolutivibrio sulfodismutans]|nr:hypothetical protein [Desulfolutivibrio sulfodismutans]QLA11879.1 hypothetical protein GD606_06195 [Desulfolutivibrio sulfodismutans DSM 3696]
MAENRVRIVIEADGRQAQTAVEALGRGLNGLGPKAQTGASGAKTALGSTTSEAKKTTAAVNETGKKLQDLGPAAQSGAGGAKVAMTNISALGGAVTRLGPAVMGAVGAFLSLRAAMDAMSTVVSRGFDFNRTMETSKLGIASILSATNELITAEGRRLQGVDKLNAAQSVSRDLMKDIQIMGLQTTATTKDLVEGFQMVLGPAGQAGLNLDQTKQTLVGIVQAFGALGIPLEQLSAEARSLFDGDIKLGQDRLAGFLGITKELVLEWQRQGVYVEKLNEKLEAFRTAGDATAQTWEGLTSNLAEAFDVLAGHATEGLFEDAKKATSEILGLLIDTKNLGLGQDIQNIAAAIRGVGDDIGGLVVSGAQALVEKIRELDRWIGENRERLAGMYETLKSIGSQFLDILGSLGSAVQSFAQMEMATGRAGLALDLVKAAVTVINELVGYVEVAFWGVSTAIVAGLLGPLADVQDAIAAIGKTSIGSKLIDADTVAGLEASAAQNRAVVEGFEKKIVGLTARYKPTPFPALTAAYNPAPAQTNTSAVDLFRADRDRVAALDVVIEKGRNQELAKHLANLKGIESGNAAALSAEQKRQAATQKWQEERIQAEKAMAFAQKEGDAELLSRAQAMKDLADAGVAKAFDDIAKAASRSGGAAARAAQEATNFLASLDDQIASAEAALSGDTLQTKLSQVDKKWNDFARRVESGLVAGKLSAEQAAEAMERIGRGRGLEKQAVQAQAMVESLQKLSGLMSEIADATGDPDLAYQAGLSEAEAWYERNKQLINQNVEDENRRLSLLEGLERGYQAKRLEAQRDAYAKMGDGSSAYWEAEKALLEQRLKMVKSKTDDEVAYKMYAAKEVDDFNRRRLEAARDNPTSLGEAMSSAFALESGSYKTSFGRAQDDWRDTTQRMLRLTDDLSSGVAQGFGDMARQGVNKLVEMLGPVGAVVGRLGDMFISLFEDIMAEWLKRNIMGLIFDDASALSQGLSGLSPGGVSGGGGGIASLATGLVGDLLKGGVSTLFQGGASAVTTGVTTGGFGLGSSLLEGMMGAGVAGAPWAGAGAGAAAGAGMGSLVLPIVGTIIGAGLGLLGSLFGEEKKEQPPQEVWSGQAVMYSGGAMGGIGYTQMSDGSYKMTALDPMEMEAERQQFAETVKDINAAAKTLEIDFDRNWDRDFSFFFPPVAEELAGLVERLMYSTAAGQVLGELSPAAQLFAEGLEGLHDTLIRLGEAFGTVANQVKPLGIDFARMGGVTDATLLSLASLATGYNAGSAILRQAQEDQAESTEELTERFLAAGEAGAEVVRYLEQYRQQLQNLALASYSEQLVDVVGGEDNFNQVISTFAERAYEDRDRTEASVNYYRSEFRDKLSGASEHFPDFDVDSVMDNPGAFWSAYRAAMEQPMPPSAFEWWADLSGIVSNLQDFQDALADIDLAERAWDQDLLARRQTADGQDSAAEMTRRAIAQEQELADARKNGATYAQQAALAETQAYELERERDRLLGIEDEADSLGEYIEDLKDAVAYQTSAAQSLAASALAASSAFGAASKSLRDTLDDMLGLDADPAVTAARASREFADLYRRTMRGDTEAAGQLAGAASDLWESGRSTYDYDSLRASIIARLGSAAAYSERQDTYQGLEGGMASAQSGLLDRLYDETSGDVPDADFLAAATEMLSRMQAFTDLSGLAAEGRATSGDVRALAASTVDDLMRTTGLAELLGGTLDVQSLTADQAKLLLSAYDAMQVLGEATGQQYDASALTLRALDALASETLGQDQWASVVEAIEAGQAEYLEWLERNIEERRAEADRLYALQEQQLEAQEQMEAYFAGISDYLLKQTQIETLSATIADLRSQASTYQQMAIQAIAMGVPMAAMMHLQEVDRINAKIAALVSELEYWIGYEPQVPGLAEGGITTRPTYALIGEGKGGRQQEAVVPLDQFWAVLERLNASFERHLTNMTGLTREVARNTATSADEARRARYAERTVSPA